MRPPEEDRSAEESRRRVNSWRDSLYPVFAAFLPGFLAGTQITGLLFFLNPHLPFGLGPILRGVAVYGVVFGLLSSLILLPFTWGRPGRARSWLPMTLTVVLAAACLSAWVHASHYAFFLPSGINRRLVKAAFWLTVAALVCFYTVLIHRLRQRPYGRRSHLLFVVLAAVSVYVVMERREAFRERPKPTPRPSTFEGTERPLLCVIGIESATLDAVLPLAEQGDLPFLSKMLSEGAHTRLKALRPVMRPSLWATLATGKLPHRHGVVGERLFDVGFLSEETPLNLLPLGLRMETWGVSQPPRPVDATTLRVIPLWEIFTRLEIPTSLVSWPLTHPSPPGVHSVLPERFFESGGEENFEPQELMERARLFRTAADELDPVFTSRFGSDPPQGVLEALAQDLWRRDLALFFLDQSPQIENLFLGLPGLLKVSQQYFGGFSAVQFQGVLNPESEEAAQLLAAYYTHLDDLLARLWEASPRPMLMVVVSTHGTEGPTGLRELRRRVLRKPALEGYTDRGTDGLLMFLGGGIAPGVSLRSAELVDLVPTLLYGIGLPSARDFDGIVLTDIFDRAFLARQPLTFVPSYETFASRPL